MRAELAAVVVLAAAGCLCGETTVTLDPLRAPIAVTASAFVHLTSRRCSEFPFDNRGNIKPHVVCSSEGVPVEAASVEDPTLFEATPDRSLVLVKALGPGASTVHARARGSSYSTQVEARTVNRVQLTLSCDEGANGPDGGTPAGAVFAAGATFRVGVASFSGDTELLGIPDQPIQCDVATNQPGSPLTFVASAVAARGRLTSGYDSTAWVPVRVFTAADITVDMPPPTTEWGRDTAMFRANLLVDGRRPCVDNLLRRFEITTPEVCWFRPSGTARDAGVPDAGAVDAGEVDAGRVYSRAFDTQVDRPYSVLATRLSAGVCTVRLVVLDRPDLTTERSHTF